MQRDLIASVLEVGLWSPFPWSCWSWSCCHRIACIQDEVTARERGLVLGYLICELASRTTLPSSTLQVEASLLL